MATPSDKAVLNAIFNPLLPSTEESNDDLESTEETLENENEKQARCLEVEGVKAAENNHIPEALKFFSQAIEVSPGRASCYNNRAQAYRLLGDIDNAKLDLDKAIQLSGKEGKAACQAFIQRAMIARLEKRENDARCDFEAAAKLGSSFAKTQLVLMNPYAAMCNKMLNEVMNKLKRGEAEDSEECHVPG